MVEEAVQHELDSMRKLVLELTGRSNDTSHHSPGPVTHVDLDNLVKDIREYNATVRGLNTKVIETRLAATDKASELLAVDIERRQKVADAAVEAVDQKAIMRSDALETHIRSVEEKVMQRITAFKELFDLGSKMGEEAINKADNANQLRFDSVNEFRAQLTDQAATFVTRTTLDAIMSQVNSSVNSLETQMRSFFEGMRDTVSLNKTEIAALNSKVLVGGSTIVVVLLVIQLVVNVFAPNHRGEDQRDLNARLDTMTSQINQNTSRLLPTTPRP